MSKFIDKEGMSSILNTIKNKFVLKENLPQKMWIGTKDEFKNIEVRDSQTIYFVKP